MLKRARTPLPSTSRTGSLQRLTFASLFNGDAFYPDRVSSLSFSSYLLPILFLLFFYSPVEHCLYGSRFIRCPVYGPIFFVHACLFLRRAREYDRVCATSSFSIHAARRVLQNCPRSCRTAVFTNDLGRKRFLIARFSL